MNQRSMDLMADGQSGVVNEKKDGDVPEGHIKPPRIHSGKGDGSRRGETGRRSEILREKHRQTD